jgi:Domain of unknown function (DUF4331)
MSSHREAPEISKDPVADSTDLYAFVSPDRPDTVTLIANYIPNEDPSGGPNFFEFGDDVVYRINVVNDDDIDADIAFEFRFTTEVTNPNTFLYNTGPITALDSPSWVRRQKYTLTMIPERGKPVVLGKNLPCPPCNIGPRSTPNYAALADAAVHDLGGGVKVFAGQRLDPFWVDLGSIFDLGALRPFQNLHLIPSAAAAGVSTLRKFCVHSLAIQVPIKMLTVDGSKPTDVTSAKSVIGFWTSASRYKASVRGHKPTGPLVQVSRLGNPLFNEVIVPMARKDEWNQSEPRGDGEYAKYVQKPELAGLLPVLYPGVFPNLAALSKPRADLDAILLTGIPNGIVPGFQNYTGAIKSDLLRLNVAIPPAATPNPLGIIGGDLAGFPNGRRLVDAVVAIELRAVAGATYPLVDPTFTPDGAASLVEDGTRAPDGFLDRFPYCGVPVSGYDVQPLS